MNNKNNKLVLKKISTDAIFHISFLYLYKSNNRVSWPSKKEFILGFSESYIYHFRLYIFSERCWEILRRSHIKWEENISCFNERQMNLFRLKKLEKIICSHWISIIFCTRSVALTFFFVYQILASVQLKFALAHTIFYNWFAIEVKMV
jgi:hypothetical protein